MALVYDLEFVDNFTTLNIIVNDDNTNPVKVLINSDIDLFQEIKDIPLFKNEKNVIITFSEVFSNNYNSVALYEKVWSKNPNITITGKELFQVLKSNVSKLYNLFKNDEKFKPAMNVYLTPSPNSGELNNGNYFPSMVAKRHMLYKTTTLLYISFTIAEKTMCDSEQSQELDYQKAKKKYNGLLKLLNDTTNLLLNIDVLNRSPSVADEDDFNVMLPSPPNTHTRI